MSNNQRSLNGCVLYVMQQDMNVCTNVALILAQQEAVAKKLPLAVVYCIDKKVSSNAEYIPLLDALLVVEKQLAGLQIPLLIVIGESKITLSSVYYHTKPVHVYYDSDTALLGGAQLHVHPYIWPGTVQSIADLKSYVLPTKQIITE